MKVVRQIDIFDNETELLAREIPLNHFDLNSFKTRFNVKKENPLMYDPYEITRETVDLFPKIDFDFKRFSYYQDVVKHRIKIKVLKTDRVDIRMKALKFNLDHLNSAYVETTRDSVTDTGIEYFKKYPYNDETRALFNKHEELKKSREEVLFFTIFNFTQVYYSIKEYLKEKHPTKKKKIEEFYNARPLGFKARKDISNDLKHNPSNDLRYGFGQIGPIERIREGSKLIERVNYRETWFYYGVDSVDYCNHLYKELKEFLDSEFSAV